jgi:hypothetical protein
MQQHMQVKGMDQLAPFFLAHDQATKEIIIKKSNQTDYVVICICSLRQCLVHLK